MIADSEPALLFGDTVTADVSDWQCYRFSNSVVVVPLRNAVLGARS